MRRRKQHDAQARAIRNRSAAARRGWETRRARISETLNKVEELADQLRATAEGLCVWDRNRRRGMGMDEPGGVHPMHAANRLKLLAEQLSSSKRKRE